MKFAQLNSLKPGKRQNNEQPKRAEKQTKARLHKKAAKSAENIFGMKRNQNADQNV